MRPRPYREATLLFTGLLYSETKSLSEAIHALGEAFGPFLFASIPAEWKFTRHYDDELGSPIFRSFLFFPPQFDPSLLADAKVRTIAIEDSLMRDGKRRINIDPGYLTLSKVVLASAKNYSHRIYLGRGIYGELTLSCHKGRYEPLPYTYYDYRDNETISLLGAMRELLKGLAGPRVIQDD